MKKNVLISLFSLLLFMLLPLAVQAKTNTFDGKGEVVSADPLYGRITIKHDAIKGFAGDEETEFVVSSNDLLKGLGRRDLVDFTIEDKNGDVQIIKIMKTGQAPPVDDRLPVGKVVQDALVATGEAAKTVTTPIEPAHELVSGTMGATTDVTGSVLKDAKPEIKQKF